jgi:plasmid stability protein
MTELNLNNIDSDLHIQLCEIAKEEGCSVEEVVQSMLRQAIEEKQRPHLATRLMDRFADLGLRDDETIEELKGQGVRSPDFDQ